MDIDQAITVGTQATRAAGTVLRDHFGKALTIRKKGVIDLVTEADLAAEQAIITTLRNAFPQHLIRAEESGRSGDDTRHVWIVDPLDGTTNFAHHLPLFAVSIAFQVDCRTMAAWIYNPVSDQLYSAVRGDGARCNGTAIGCSRADRLEDALLVTGFAYNIREKIDPVMARFRRCLTVAQGVRRLGSAALDLCLVASGSFDGFWEEDLHPWDTAAGALVVTESGGLVTDFQGRPHDPDQRQILATNGFIHQQLLARLQGEDASDEL
jgi:myo-inositol-1(or 4)-monophosphatase